MKRVIIHWTAGTNKASSTDRKHYHYIVEGDGNVVAGDLPPEANENTRTAYAAHTRGMNTGSIGVSFAAMFNARERPFDAGKHPITEKQVAAMVRLVAQLCAKYGIPVTRDTVLSHAEVQGTLGVTQLGKWDVSWLPGMDQAGNAQAVGDLLRYKIKAAMAPEPKPVTTAPQSGIVALIIAAIKAIFGGAKS